MGIGRREFLRLFSVGLAAAASPASAIAISDNHYINRRLGIAFTKPNKWVFAGIQQMANVKAGQILDLDDPELSQLIVEHTELPILTVSKGEVRADSHYFTPGATVYLDRITPEAKLEHENLSTVENLQADAETCCTVLNGFHLLSDVCIMRVSACPAAQYVASFTFEHENMKPTPVRMRTLVIDQGTASYTLRMYDSPYLGGEMAFDYSPFIESIRMV